VLFLLLVMVVLVFCMAELRYSFMTLIGITFWDLAIGLVLLLFPSYWVFWEEGMIFDD
jgi:hypothetical protein